MIKIGLTGNIGSGKTTIAKEFERYYGVPVFNSDKAARDLEKDPELMKQFTEIVGEQVFFDGVMDRDKMRSIIFNDRDKLDRVNKLMGPRVLGVYNDFLLECEKEGHRIVMLESAIIFETNREEQFDETVCVVASKHTRLERVMGRDGLTEELALAKMNMQMDDVEKALKADHCVYNELTDESGQLVATQVSNIMGYISRNY